MIFELCYIEVIIGNKRLAPLFNYRLVRKVAQTLQYEKTTHQTDGFGRTTIVGTVQRGEGFFKTIPVYFVPKLE